MKAIGLMSGTSVDGIDAVMVEIPDDFGDDPTTHVRLVGFATYPYPAGVRERILNVSTPGQGTVDQICHLNAYLGELFARAAIQIARETGISLDEIEIIGSHGQTIQHRPQPQDEAGIIVTSTFQVGEPSIIAERTGVTTVADFRPRDLAAGGQGAPLAPYAHYLLFRHPTTDRVIANIGGISNVTWIPAGASSAEVIAFDTGPGNMLIDQVMSLVTRGAVTYDQDGQRAARGTWRAELLAWLLRHPYLERQPPKSTGREEFGAELTRALDRQRRMLGVSDDDLLATVTEFTAATIVQSCQTWLPMTHERVGANPLEFVGCGGGMQNHTLMTALRQRLSPIPVLTVEALQMSSAALEAIIFALLARETLLGRPANLPSVTGATHPVVLGKILPGNRFRGLRV